MSRPTGMRISPSAVLIGVFAALSGWMVRGIQFDPGPQISTVAPPSAVAGADAGIPLQVMRPADASYASRNQRNLFAYTEREPLPAAFHPAPAAVTVVPPPVVPPPIDEHPRARFPHRYIGRFGPDHRPFAAFARDGQVVTVRPGDPIDERFVLRSIGMESVEVEASVDGAVQSLRVSFDERL